MIVIKYIFITAFDVGVCVTVSMGVRVCCIDVGERERVCNCESHVYERFSIRHKNHIYQHSDTQSSS